MMSIYPIVRIQLSFVQSLLLCYEFCISSKTECKSIYYHFRHDQKNSSFRKLARNKWICQETCEFFFRDQLRHLSWRKRPPNEDKKSNKRQCLRSENERRNFKSNVFTAMVLVSLILKTQIGTSLRRLEQRIPPFINKHWTFVRLERTV